MSCEKCKDLCVRFAIRQPHELRRAIQIAKQNLDDGTITEVPNPDPISQVTFAAIAKGEGRLALQDDAVIAGEAQKGTEEAIGLSSYRPVAEGTLGDHRDGTRAAQGRSAQRAAGDNQAVTSIGPFDSRRYFLIEVLRPQAGSTYVLPCRCLIKYFLRDSFHGKIDPQKFPRVAI